jgi:hypothetical protein
LLLTLQNYAFSVFVKLQKLLNENYESV